MNWVARIILLIIWSLSIDIGYAEEKWIADEIFLQISEMRKQIQTLQQKVAGLEQQLVDQKPKLEPIVLAGLEHMTLGESSATIAILEFSDYECPYCSKHYQNVLPKLRERYIDTGIVKYVIKDFPLEFHANAKKASLATRCAGEQGHYWQMHNAIFDMHGQVSDALIDTTVKQLKLNNQIFKHCLANPKHIVAIEKDIALGASLGVNGTPAFVIGVIKNNQLINYKRFDGVQSFETFATMIDSFKKQ